MSSVTHPRVPRVLGRSGIEVAALGMGTWQIGGPLLAGEQRLGWGEVDDEESVRALRCAADLGVTLFDTADSYGAGHAERVLGRALGDRREDLVWVTKWGNTFDDTTRQRGEPDATPAHAARAFEDSLRRLGTDYLDVWLFHLAGAPAALAEDLVALCEDLVDQGRLRTYGWSTDDPARAAAFARGARCAVVEHQLDVLDDNVAMVALCRELDLAGLARSPLAMGLLTDAVTADTRLAPDDVRHRQPPWLHWFRRGRPDAEFLARREAVREVLTSEGRTLVQGALAWVWARAEHLVPVPGCRTVAEVEENAAALDRGPLTPDQMAEVERLLRPDGPLPWWESGGR